MQPAMGNLNQLDFLLENRHRVESPILEIGSCDYGNSNDFRRFFPEFRYLGVDRELGPGVDAACDFTEPLESLQNRIGDEKFRTVICFSVMEHCKDPFKMAGNITSVAERKGTLFLSVPWVWNIHAFPDDYWRFTPSAIRLLFPEFEIVEELSFWSTKNRGERYPLGVKKLLMYESMFFKNPAIAEELRRQGLTNFRHPYYCYPVLLNMLLVRK